MPVKMAPDLELPDNAITQKYAFIGRTGTGKSYTARKLVEGLLTLNAQTIILDPSGDWWGLRLNASGKGPGFPIPVFGGEHGDIEIKEEHAEPLATLIIEQDLSCIIDVSQFRKNARRRFATILAEELFHRGKTRRKARMFVGEEIQMFAPQSGSGTERMLGAFEDLIRVGRTSGWGACMITQRPQQVEKSILNQAECLFVGQLTGKHERDAVEGWVSEHRAEKGWVAKLPSLEKGDFVVWSPAWLKVMKQVHIDKCKTFDSSATPELGAVQPSTKKLTAIDVPALQAALLALAGAAKPTAGSSTAVVAEIERLQNLVHAVEIERDELASKLEQAEKDHATFRRHTVDALHSVQGELSDLERNTTEAATRLSLFLDAVSPADPPRTEPQAGGLWVNSEDGTYRNRARPPARAPEPPPAPLPAPSAPEPSRAERAAARAQKRAEGTKRAPEVGGYRIDHRLPLQGVLNPGARKMLQACCDVWPYRFVNREQMAAAAGLKARGGNFNTAMKQIKHNEMLTFGPGGEPMPTPEARRQFVSDRGNPAGMSPLELAEYFRPHLPQNSWRILEQLMGRGARTPAQLGEALGLVPRGGNWNSATAALRHACLVHTVDGKLDLHPWLVKP